MISIKVHSKGRELLVAACDSDLLGRTFRSEKLRIDVSREFYHAEECEDDVFVARLRIATVANLVGEHTVGLAVKHGVIDPECVMDIGGVPHAQMARMI